MAFDMWEATGVEDKALEPWMEPIDRKDLKDSLRERP
jgi:hypothetical protein